MAHGTPCAASRKAGGASIKNEVWQVSALDKFMRTITMGCLLLIVAGCDTNPCSESNKLKAQNTMLCLRTGCAVTQEDLKQELQYTSRCGNLDFE